MSKTLLLHDINASNCNAVIANKTQQYTIFEQSDTVKPCLGCFGCWVKTPGKCVVDDKDRTFATIMPHVSEIIIISRLVFGGLSPNIKAVLDRSIGFILPYFRIINGQMHHKQRYAQCPSLKYMFYGQGITEEEKATAEKLIKANAVNLGAEEYSVAFYSLAEEALENLA